MGIYWHFHWQGNIIKALSNIKDHELNTQVFEQTCTKTPFLVEAGDVSAMVVMFDTAQIFFVVGSCGRNNKFHQDNVFVLKYTNNMLAFWWKLKLNS